MFLHVLLLLSEIFFHLLYQTCNEGDLGSIPGWERAPGERNGYPLQYSSLENSTGCSPWGWKESDSTEWLPISLYQNLTNYSSLRKSQLSSHFLESLPQSSKWSRDPCSLFANLHFTIPMLLVRVDAHKYCPRSMNSLTQGPWYIHLEHNRCSSRYYWMKD